MQQKVSLSTQRKIQKHRFKQRDGIYRASIICRNPWSQVSLPHFITFTMFWFLSMVLVFVLIWVKSVLRCQLYIFHLCGWSIVKVCERAPVRQKVVSGNKFQSTFLTKKLGNVSNIKINWPHSDQLWHKYDNVRWLHYKYSGELHQSMYIQTSLTGAP